MLPPTSEDGVAVVTGASSGIGEQIAREFARRGYRLVLVARRANRLRGLAEELDGRAHVLPADLSNRDERAALPDQVAALGVLPDVLVNNAGLSTLGPVAESNPEAELNLIEVDVAAVVDLCSRFVPGMVKRGRGAVLNVASVGAFGPVPGQASYGAAKAFVLSYTQAMREGRHKVAEDFAAVAKDLVSRDITTVEQLSAAGGSNGGLLMGIMLTQYPELFGALVCSVPLLDMRRFHLLLAGASWVAEYGDPDEPADWEFIEKYSPYHHVSADRHYPPLLITTSTRDDRVHPGHARKMTAALEAAGHRVRYYENIEGGHAGAADNKQAAFKSALMFEFLWRTIGAASPAAQRREPSR